MQENQQSLDTNKRKGAGHAWLIGGIAVLALILAWVAFNRSGEDVIPTAAEEAAEAERELEASVEATAEAIEETIVTATAEARVAAARVEARADLLALQTKLQADAAYENTTEDLNQIEADLEVAYTNTSADLQSEYQEIQSELETLGDAIQNGTADVLESIAEVSLMFKADVRANE